MNKLNTALLLIIIMIIIVFATRNYLLSRSDDSGVVPKRFKGSENAVLNITEYIDFQCPSCAYGAKYLKDVMDKNPELIRLELRYFPLRGHKHAFLAAKYTECALRQGQFWELHDKIIDQQQYWSGLVNALPAFDALVKDLPIDDAKFRACLADPSVEEEINQHKAEGAALGIASTPTYFINGVMVVGSKSLMDEISKHLPIPAQQP